MNEQVAGDLNDLDQTLGNCTRFLIDFELGGKYQTIRKRVRVVGGQKNAKRVLQMIRIGTAIGGYEIHEHRGVITAPLGDGREELLAYFVDATNWGFEDVERITVYNADNFKLIPLPS